MKSTLAAAAIAVFLSGCASIFNGPTQSVSVQSVPEGASVSVTNKAGDKIHSGTAPVTITLKRGAGYFKSEVYTFAFTKEGYATKELIITGGISGWYFGNILLGGVIGMVAVDPVTGAMYGFPETVVGTLESAPKTSEAPQSLKVVTTDSLTPAQLKQAQLLVAAK
jgi:hypothetical protein